MHVVTVIPANRLCRIVISKRLARNLVVLTPLKYKISPDGRNDKIGALVITTQPGKWESIYIK